MADVYQRRIGVPDTPRLGMADVASGMALGRGIEELGEAVSDYQNDQALAKNGKSIADYQVALAKYRQEQQANAPAGATGYDDAITKWKQANQPTIQGDMDRRSRQALQKHLDAINNDASIDDQAFVIRKQAEQTVQDATTRRDSSLNLIQNAPSLAAAQPIVAREQKAYSDWVDSLKGIDGNAKALAKQQYEQGVARAVSSMGLDRGEVASVRQLADSGAFNALPAQELAQLKRSIGVEERRQQAVAAHQGELLKAQARERLATLNARLEAGEDVPDAELQQGAALATAIGDESGAYKLGVAQLKSGINRSTQPWLPQQYEAEIGRLLAKGEKRSAVEDIELKQLQSIAPDRTKAVQNDPAQWAALNGNPAPALDPGDPASVAARVKWAAGVSRATRLPPQVLTPGEAEELKAQVHGTVNQRMEAAQTIARFGGGAEPVLRQVAGDDEAFKQVTRLAALPDGGVNARDALTGGDALKANPNLFRTRDNRDVHEDMIFAQATGPALRWMPPSYRAAVMANARNIYAARMSRNGQTTWDEGRFRGAIQSALGSLNRNGVQTGGIVAYRNGAVLLPTGMTADTFQQKLARSSADQLVKAAGGVGAVWANGKEVTATQLRTLMPVPVGDGFYKFTDGSGFIQRKGIGGDWVVDLRSKALP